MKERKTGGLIEKERSSSTGEISAALSPWWQGSLQEKEIDADSNDSQVNTLSCEPVCVCVCVA